jgi:RNA polymerase sigma factor (sigma-70 family)
MDSAAFKSLVLPLSNKLMRFAYSILHEACDAEDAVQEVFLRLWKLRNQLATYNNVEAFALTITKNLCLDRIKAKKPLYIGNYGHSHDLGTEESNPQTLLEKSDHHALFTKIIDNLPEQQRLILNLREMQHLEYDEIAVITGMQINAIRVNLSRARNKIREELLKYEKIEFQSVKSTAR